MIVGYKHDEGKPRTDLIPARAILQMANVLTFGADLPGYSDNGWKEVSDSTRKYTGAALRHIFKFMDGQQNDEKSGMHHLAHAMTDLAFIVELDGQAVDFQTFGGDDVRPQRTQLKFSANELENLAQQIRETAHTDSVVVLSTSLGVVEIAVDKLELNR